MASGVVEEIWRNEAGEIQGELRDAVTGRLVRFEVPSFHVDRIHPFLVGDRVTYLEPAPHLPVARVISSHGLGLPVYLHLEHPRTGHRESIKVGFSWDALLLQPLLGYSLFRRRLYLLGLANLIYVPILLIGSAHLISEHGPTGGHALDSLYLALGILYWLFLATLALGANRWHIRKLAAQGYRLAAPVNPFQARQVETYAGLPTGLLETAPSSLSGDSEPDRLIPWCLDRLERLGAMMPLGAHHRLRRLDHLRQEGLLDEREHALRREAIILTL
jgi:hypothetical protein